MKALLLAAGKGKRLHGCGEASNKCLIKAGGRHLIEYSLELIVRTNIIEDVIIVVGHAADNVIDAIGRNYENLKIEYVFQDQQRGLVDAIDCAKKLLNDDFYLLLGDEYMVNARPDELVKMFYNQKCPIVCGTIEVTDFSRIRNTYTMLCCKSGLVHRLIEKPKKPLNNLMGTGNVIFKFDMLKYVPETPVNQIRNEKELPDLIQTAIDAGEMVLQYNVCDEYVNINSIADLQEVQSSVRLMMETELSVV